MPRRTDFTVDIAAVITAVQQNDVRCCNFVSFYCFLAPDRRSHWRRRTVHAPLVGAYRSCLSHAHPMPRPACSSWRRPTTRPEPFFPTRRSSSCARYVTVSAAGTFSLQQRPHFPPVRPPSPWPTQELPGCLVVVDEAYAEFCDSSALELFGQYDNLIICRTLSKW